MSDEETTEERRRQPDEQELNDHQRDKPADADTADPSPIAPDAEDSADPNEDEEPDPSNGDGGGNGSGGSNGSDGGSSPPTDEELRLLTFLWFLEQNDTSFRVTGFQAKQLYEHTLSHGGVGQVYAGLKDRYIATHLR